MIKRLNKRNILFILVILICFAILCNVAKDSAAKESLISKNKAVQIAETEWMKKFNYSKKNLNFYMPYNIELKNGIWKISGALPKDWDGGVPEIEIRAKNGAIISITHGK